MTTNVTKQITFYRKYSIHTLCKNLNKIICCVRSISFVFLFFVIVWELNLWKKKKNRNNMHASCFICLHYFISYTQRKLYKILINNAIVNIKYYRSSL